MATGRRAAGEGAAVRRERDGYGERGDVIGRDRVADFSRADACDTRAAGGHAARRGGRRRMAAGIGGRNGYGGRDREEKGDDRGRWNLREVRGRYIVL